MKKKKDSVSITVTILILTTFALVAVVTGVYYFSFSRGIIQVEFNNIQKNLVSSKDNSHHTIDISFSIDISKSYSRDIDKKLMQKTLEEAVSNLNYVRLTQSQNVEYILDEVYYELSKIMPDDKIKGIYISNVHSDFDLLPNEGDSDESNGRNKVFNSLFKKN